MECKVLYELLPASILKSYWKPLKKKNLMLDLKMFSKGKMLPFPIGKFTHFFEPCYIRVILIQHSSNEFYGGTFITDGTQRVCLFACLYQMKRCLTTITIRSGVPDTPIFQHSFTKGLLSSVFIRTFSFQFNTEHILLPLC